MLCSATKPNLPGWRRRAGDDHALAGRTARAKLLGRRAHRSRSHLDQRVDRDRHAVDDDQRVEVGATRSSAFGVAASDSPSSTSASASRSTAGSPRNAPSSAWVARSSIISSASTAVDRHEPERHVARPPRRAPRRRRASRVMPNCGSRTSPAISSRLPVHHRRDEHADLAVVGPSPRRAARRPRPRTASASAQAEAHEAALGLVRDRVAAELHDDRDSRSRRLPRPRRRHVGHDALVEHGHAVASERAPSTRPRRGSGMARSVRCLPDRPWSAMITGVDRGLLRHAVVLGRRASR